MTGLFISISDYVDDPEVEEVDKAIQALEEIEGYYLIPSRSNVEGWEDAPYERHGDSHPRKKTPHTPARGRDGRFVRKS